MTIPTPIRARKPVIVRRFSREVYTGYASVGWDAGPDWLEILDSAGKLLRIEWTAIKWVCFVRDLSGLDPGDPEHLVRKRFRSRPRSPGVWLRMTLADGEELEGLAANDRGLIHGVGLFLMPPDTRSATQRILVPRAAIRELQVLAVIGAPAKRAPAEPYPELFPALFNGRE